MSIQRAPVPEIAAQRFADDWPAYDIPAVWVDLVEAWTLKLMEAEPDFKYQEITVKFDTQARVHIITHPSNYRVFRQLIADMNHDLSSALLENNRS